MPEPNAAQLKLADVLGELCMEIAELNAAAEEHRAFTEAHALRLRERVEKVARMGGLGELPEWRVRRKVERVG